MKNGTKTSLFLIEFIAALLLFAFCAAVSVRLFAGAGLHTREALDLSRAVINAGSAAELYKEYGGDLDKVAERLGGSSDEDSIIICYDADWNVDDSGGTYFLEINRDGVITVSKIKSSGLTELTLQIYTLTVKAVS